MACFIFQLVTNHASEAFAQGNAHQVGWQAQTAGVAVLPHGHFNLE